MIRQGTLKKSFRRQKNKKNVYFYHVSYNVIIIDISICTRMYNVILYNNRNGVSRICISPSDHKDT